MSIADRCANCGGPLAKCSGVNYNAHMQISDAATTLGVMQAGFNDMVPRSAERQRLRDLFGRFRYVGEDVDRRAGAWAPELGGQETRRPQCFSSPGRFDPLDRRRSRPPQGRQLLNEFFVSSSTRLNRHGVSSNKFPGDAASASSARPDRAPDACGAALGRTSREMNDDSHQVLGGTEFGIGGSDGRAIAGQSARRPDSS